MADIEQSWYEAAAEALGAQREAFQHYLQLVDAQRAALQSHNLRTMMGLSERLNALLAEIEERGRRLLPVHRLVARSSAVGPRPPRMRALVDLMRATATDAVMAQARVRDLTGQLAAARDRTRRDLHALDSRSRGSVARSGTLTPQPALIDARG